MIATIGRGILGLTVQCARCHNHKFDPIPQKDYYKMQASLFGYVETDHPLTPQQEAEAYQKKVAEVDAQDHAAEAARFARSRSPTGCKLRAGKIQEVSGERPARHRDSRRQANARTRRCWPTR